MQTKETTKNKPTKMGGMGLWLHVDMDECREKKKQKKISDLLADMARDVDVLRAMLHGYAGADVDGCGCGWMRMRMDVDADVV